MTRLTVGLLMAAIAVTVGRAQTPPAQRPQPPLGVAPAPEARQWKPLAEGILQGAAPLFATDSIPGFHVEARDLILGPRKEAPVVPLKGYTIMELLSGEADVTIGERTTHQRAGTFWFVPRGKALAIRSTGETAVLRAITLTPK